MTAVHEQEVAADVVEAPEKIKQTNNSVEQEGKEDSKITLDAALTIQNVSALYEQMQVLLDKQEEIEIDASLVTSVDTSTLQLLVVLKQTAIKLHKKVSIDFPSDNFIEAAELLGLAEMLDVDQAAAGFF